MRPSPAMEWLGQIWIQVATKEFSKDEDGGQHALKPGFTTPPGLSGSLNGGDGPADFPMIQ